MRVRLPLILASSSPRRADLMRLLGVPFEIISPSVSEQEITLTTADFGNAVLVNASAKARAVDAESDRIVIAADTIVACNDRAFGKPIDNAGAEAMLRQLSGKTHTVITGVCVRHGSSQLEETVETRVTMFALTDELIAAYVATGEPRDKAGAYGIQERGGLLVERIEGDYYNVVGLPIAQVAAMLEKTGVSFVDYW